MRTEKDLKQLEKEAPQQYKIWLFILGYLADYEKHGFKKPTPPSETGIAGVIGISRQAVHDHLEALERKKYLKLKGRNGRSRGIKIITN